MDPWHGVVDPVIAEGCAGTVFTVIVTMFDVSDVGATHASDDVIMQVTVLPFASVELAYVAELVPTFVPFNCHW